MNLITFSLTLFAVASAVSSQLIFKSWTASLGQISVSLKEILPLIAKIGQSPLMILGLFLYGAGFIAWIFLLTRANLSLVYPVIVSLNIMLVILFSYFFFREAVVPLQFAGIAAILVGIFLIFAA